MTHKRIGQVVFFGAVAVAAALYSLTAPEGLPWNASTHLALAYLGEIVRPPEMPHPVWGCYVQVFGGAVALSVFLAALAAGLIGAMVNRAVGWRFAVAAALAWIFLPGVWNRAITGERSICLAAMVIVAAWLVLAVALRVTKKMLEVRSARRSAPAGWVAIGVSALFALVSSAFHDYRRGEPASAFARGVADAAGKRIIVLNGVCDAQVVRAVRTEGEDDRHCLSQRPFSTLSLRNTDANRSNIVAWLKREWPEETNLWISATVSPQRFVDAAMKKFPERFYLMDGTSTTLERWEIRWEAFKPYLKTSDPFVSAARRVFGYEGNVVANALLEGRGTEAGSERRNSAEKNSATAWRLYRRVYEEVDPGNFSALVNMGEMIRRGYAAGGDERKRVQAALEKAVAGEPDPERLRRLARMTGPVRADVAQLERLRAEAKSRITGRIAAGEKVSVAPEILTLLEWNNEMIRLMNKGEIVAAGRIARVILTNPKWRDFIPANAVMGAVTAREGDPAASEAFFRVATDTTNAVPAAVLNDSADVLMHLGKMDEAEELARRAVKASDESFWVARLTLAQILRKKAKSGDEGKARGEDAEVKALLKSALKSAPAEKRARIRKDCWDCHP